MPFTQGHALLIGVSTYQYEQQMNVPVTAAGAQNSVSMMRSTICLGSFFMAATAPQAR